MKLFENGSTDFVSLIFQDILAENTSEIDPFIMHVKKKIKAGEG